MNATSAFVSSFVPLFRSASASVRSPPPPRLPLPSTSRMPRRAAPIAAAAAATTASPDTPASLAPISRVPSSSSSPFSDSVTHANVVYLSSIAPASPSDPATEISSVLSLLLSRLSDASSSPSSLLSLSVSLAPPLSPSDFTSAWASSPLLSSSHPVITFTRVSEILSPAASPPNISLAATAARTPVVPAGVVRTDAAAAAVGAYSQAIVATDGTVYVSGCIGLTTGPDAVLAGPTVQEQTEQALSNLKNILEAAGCRPNDIVKTLILLDDMADFATVNEMYKDFFGDGRVPARSCFAADALPKGALVEIEAVAKQRQ